MTCPPLIGQYCTFTACADYKASVTCLLSAVGGTEDETFKVALAELRAIKRPGQEVF